MHNYEMILANGSRVKVSDKEIREFITESIAPIANAYWPYSELLSQEEVMRFLAGESSRQELRKVAQYLLIFAENISFSAYLFDKSEGNPDQTKEFNMPAIKKLRELYQAAVDGGNPIGRKGIVPLRDIVSEMEGVCMKIGVDPL